MAAKITAVLFLAALIAAANGRDLRTYTAPAAHPMHAQTFQVTDPPSVIYVLNPVQLTESAKRTDTTLVKVDRPAPKKEEKKPKTGEESVIVSRRATPFERLLAPGSILGSLLG